MSGTRGGRGRIVAMGICLVAALLLLGASEARAGKYAVAQCGWHLGSEAAWADTTGERSFARTPIARPRQMPTPSRPPI